MKTSIEIAEAFKKCYSKTMRGTQRVTFHNGDFYDFDDRKYYQGRGKKYNNGNIHEHIEVNVTVSELRAYKNREKVFLRREAEQRIYDLKDIYEIGIDNYVRLNECDKDCNSFNVEKLAKTMSMDVKDLELLKSQGKTYLFVKDNYNQLYLFFHPHLSINTISIYVKKVTEEYYNDFVDKWGYNDSLTHFVC